MSSGRLDPRQRFTETVDDYARYRPSYPEALVDWVLERTRLGPGARVLDLGCGTGISSRLFASRGLEVIGVDPNPAMLKRAEQAGGGPRYVRGEALATGLAAHSVDLVIIAQAFHWFYGEPVLAELGRVLAPGGACAPFWNVRDDRDPAMAEYEALLQTLEAYRAVDRFDDVLDWIDARSDLAPIERAEFPHHQQLDREAFFGRVFSSSYVVHGVSDRAAFERRLDDFFARHAVEGALAFRYRTKARLFRPPGS